MYRQLFIKIPISYFTKSSEIFIEPINRNAVLFIHPRIPGSAAKVDTFEYIFKSDHFFSLCLWTVTAKPSTFWCPSNIYTPVIKPFVWTCATITCNQNFEAAPSTETIHFSVFFVANIKFSGHNFWKKYFMKVLFKLVSNIVFSKLLSLVTESRVLWFGFCLKNIRKWQSLKLCMNICNWIWN